MLAAALGDGCDWRHDARVVTRCDVCHRYLFDVRLQWLCSGLIVNLTIDAKGYWVEGN